ncbi:hypothetical protein D9615_007848 [Tricholomella constricta]|uniref:Fungal-type protein kinase domain-containing protein n=1 Tax=Tricholomella constricta TaxID=117010 RepID=A0A8H5H4X3_9AGAR|nr:hypothetical protein D9615_007848 [Tricholomella constricta]
MPVGTPIKHFCDLLELTRCFHGSPTHAHNNLIIHRDVSIGNLLIYPPRQDGEETLGRLRDFDHAKKALGSKPPPAREVPEFEMMPLLPLATKQYEAIVEAFRYAKEGAFLYIADVKRYRFGPKKGSATIANLGWDHPEEAYLNLKLAGMAFVLQGTLPFISQEVLQQSTLKIYFKAPGKHDFSHNSIHDMESFLWVLIYICLSRSSPGIGILREELNPSHEKYASRGELAKAIFKYFEAEELELGLAKRQLFTNTNPDDIFETAIIRLFHPCFEPLKPLVRQWWATLKLAYVYHGNEYYHIHAHVFRLLEATLSDLQKCTDLGQEAATTRELKRRKSHTECLQVTATLDPTMDTITPPMFLVAPQTTPEYHQSISSSDSIIPPDSPTRRPAMKKRRVF